MTSSMAKYKEAVRNSFGKSRPGSEGATFVPIVSRWTLAIKHIRQTSYDDTNNIRICDADFVYNFPLPLYIALFTAELPGAKALCTGAVSYKIERTLDDPGGIYVTHYCR